MAFIGYTTASVPASGGTITLHLENPTDNRMIDVHNLIITTQFEGQYWIYDVFDGDVTGSEVTTDNLRLDEMNGAPDSGNMNMNNGVTFTATGTHFHESVPSGGPGGNMGGKSTGPEPLIGPGREIVIELQNDSGSDNMGTIGIVYSERERTDTEG